jgi:hypothetical protein
MSPNKLQRALCCLIDTENLRRQIEQQRSVDIVAAIYRSGQNCAPLVLVTNGPSRLDSTLPPQLSD